MPRTARASLGGWCYHVLNRGNARAEVFHKDADYAAFINLFEPACDRVPMRILGYCLMPNHFHLVLWPHKDGDLGRWMQWLMTSHVRRYHRHYGGSGHVWQGRFKAFPIQEDDTTWPCSATSNEIQCVRISSATPNRGLGRASGSASCQRAKACSLPGH